MCPARARRGRRHEARPGRSPNPLTRDPRAQAAAATACARVSLATAARRRAGSASADDDIDVVAGRRDHLAGEIQERYGIAKDDAEKQLAEWERKASDSWFTKS